MRRYPDLIVHRLLRAMLRDGASLPAARFIRRTNSHGKRIGSPGTRA
ncbi:hypothetical protein [Amaricoccus sp.]